MLCSTNPALTDEPDVNVVVCVPWSVVVCAVLDIVVWFGTPEPLDPLTSYVCVAMLLFPSVAVMLTFPDRPLGMVT